MSDAHRTLPQLCSRAKSNCYQTDCYQLSCSDQLESIGFGQLENAVSLVVLNWDLVVVVLKSIESRPD